MFNRKTKQAQQGAAQAHSRIHNLEQENEGLRGIVERIRSIVQTNRKHLDVDNARVEALPGEIAADLVELAKKRRAIGGVDTERLIEKDVAQKADHLNEIQRLNQENRASMYVNLVKDLESVFENQESEITEQGHV